jgi:Ca-activated chloride channel family protein
MNEASYQKKALLLVTDGIDNSSKGTLEKVLERVKREHVMVFAIGLLSQSGGVEAEAALEKIADVSGGRAYFPQTPKTRVSSWTSLPGIFASNTHSPTSLECAEKRRVAVGRVEISPPKGYPKDLSTNYRHGYYAPEPD